MFVIDKILSALLLPPGILILIAAFAAVFAWKGKRKIALALSLVELGLVYLLSARISARMIIAPLEDGAPPLAAATGAKAVLVLGGGFQPASPE